MEKDNNILEEKIIEKYSDGSYKKKVVYRTPVHNMVVKAEISLMSNDDKEINTKAFYDIECKKPIYELNIEYLNAEEIIVKQICEELQENNWFSVIQKRKNNIPQKSTYFYDKEFKNICMTETYEYLNENNYDIKATFTEKQENLYYSFIETTKNKKPFSAKLYKDKNFKELVGRIYCSYDILGNRIYKKNYETVVDGCRSIITTINKKNEVICEKLFEDKNFKQLQTKRINKFQSDGNCISYFYEYDKDTAVYSHYIAKYDKKDRLIEEKYYDGKIFKKLSSKACRIYDEQNNYLEKYVAYKEKSFTISQYNADNLLISRKKFTTIDYKNLDFSQKFERNEDGRFLVKTVFENERDCAFSAIENYNADATLLSVQYFKDKNFENLYKTIEHKYNNGKLYRKIGFIEDDYSENEDFCSWIDNFNLNGYLISSKRYKDNKFEQLYYTNTPFTKGLHNEIKVNKFVIEEGFHEYCSAIDKKNPKGLFYEGTKYKNKDFTDEIRTTYRKYTNKNSAHKQIKCCKKLQNGDFNTEFEEYENGKMISSKKCKLPRFVARILLFFWI